MTETKLYRRILRREMHRSRSGAIVVVLFLVVAGAIYLGIECVLAAFDAPALFVSPSAFVAAFDGNASWMRAAGIVAVVLGVVLILLALLPGRRARHSVGHNRMAIVVDDGVLAGAIAGEARRVARVSSDRVSAGVSRRRATVLLTSTSGIPISQRDVQDAADQLLGALNPRPTMRAGVAIAASGMVGS